MKNLLGRYLSGHFLTIAVVDIVVGQVGVGAAPGEVGRRLRGRYHGGRTGERVPGRPRGGSAVDKLAVRLDARGVGEARGGAAPRVGGHGEEEVVGEERLVGLDVEMGKKGTTCRKNRFKLVVDKSLWIMITDADAADRDADIYSLFDQRVY